MSQQSQQNLDNSSGSLAEQLRKSWPFIHQPPSMDLQKPAPSDAADSDEPPPPEVDGIEVQILR